MSIEDKIVQAHYIEILARKLSVPVEAVFGQIEKNPSASLRTSEDVAIYGQAKTRRQLLEEKLLVNAISQKSKLIFKKETKELVSSEFILKVINNFEKNKNLPEELKEGYGEMVLANSESEDIDKIIFELTKLKLKQDLEDLGEKIKLDENNKELLTEFGEISKKLSTL